MKSVDNSSRVLPMAGAALILVASLVPVAAVAAANLEDSVTTQVFELPKLVGDGPGREVSVQLDEGHLKLATITLRKGTVLDAHSAPVPATILVLEGEGVMNIGGKSIPASRGTLVSLPAGEEHDVVPRPGSDMLLLVHYLRGAGDEAPTEGHQH